MHSFLRIRRFSAIWWLVKAGDGGQSADGIIETCTHAVTLALGLIGIMALFMGLVSIAEQAGGMRFLARITAPFFSRLFPICRKGTPRWAIWS
jgi:spore maturation protein SpmA